MNRYTPTWNYIASGLNFLIDKEVWKVENNSGSEHYRIPEGVRLILILAYASVVEGSLKTYLIGTINKTFEEKDRIENLINNDALNSEAKIQESETLFFPNPSRQELIKRKDENDQLFIRIKNLTTEEVESATWNNLIGLFKKITGNELMEMLDNKRKDLSKDINMIFSFRNFIIHSNSLQLQILAENEFSFQAKSKDLIEYLIKNNLLRDNYKSQEKYFIEYLMPEKIILHFKKTVDDYFDVSFLKECLETKNLVNFIYNQGH